MNRASRVMQLIELLCLCLVMVLAAAAGSKPLEEALNSKYEIAKTGIDRLRITKPGTVLVIQEAGIYANPSTDMGTLTTKVVDGR